MEAKIEIGKYTATWVSRDICNGGCIYLLDQYLDKPYQMVNDRKNCKSYWRSELRHELNADFEKDKNFDRFRPFLLPVDPYKTGSDLISIPTISQFFGGLLEEAPDDEPERRVLINTILNNFDTDQLDRNTIRWEYWHALNEKNARMTNSDIVQAGWLQDVSYYQPDNFGCFTNSGYLTTSVCTKFLGVRPIIKLIEK